MGSAIGAGSPIRLGDATNTQVAEILIPGAPCLMEHSETNVYADVRAVLW